MTCPIYSMNTDDPLGAGCLQFADSLLQRHRDPRVGEVRMQGAIEIGAEELKLDGHGHV